LKKKLLKQRITETHMNTFFK